MNTLTDLSGTHNHHSITVNALSSRFIAVCFMIFALLMASEAQASAHEAWAIASAEQTYKPKVTINNDGSISVEKHESGDAETKFYYTTDGSAPTKESKPYSGVIPSAETNGKVIKIIAVSGDNNPSDIVTAYVNVSASFTWSWNTTGDLQTVPTIEGNSIADIMDKGTKAVIGKKLKQGIHNQDNIIATSFTPVTKDDVVDGIDEESSLAFNIIPKAGISFRPTGVSFSAMAFATGSGLMDVELECESNKYPLIQSVLPSRDNMQTFSADDFKTNIAGIPGAAEEWALKIHIYTLTLKKEWGFNDIVVSGTFSGVEYEGLYHNVSATAEPAEGGKVSHSPAALSIVAGKSITLTATPSRGYKFVKWSDYDTSSDMGDTQEIHIDKLEKDLNCEAIFERLPLISFDKGKTEIDGNVPDAIYTDNDGGITIPQNTTLFKENYALTGWTDGVNIYSVGTRHIFTQDVKLTPVVTRCERHVTDTGVR